MDKRGQIIILIVALLYFISACATQPEKIIETVIVQITATPLPTIESTPTEEPTDIPTEVPTETQEQVLGNAPACIPPNAEISLGVVTEVLRGNIIKVITDGQTYTVRYIGIDTPGPEETAKNLELVMGEVVSLVKDVSETDQNDSLLRYVFVGDLEGVFVNHELVRSGHATVNTYPPDVACSEYFLQTEQEARANALGLWGVRETIIVMLTLDATRLQSTSTPIP